MIISHKYKFVFVHIPKCAGTSITYTLLPYLGENDLFLSRDKLHLRAKEARFEYFESEKQWNSYFRFAFYRNPWERLHSLYHFEREAAKRWRGHFDLTRQWHKRLVDIDLSLSFDDYVKRICRRHQRSIVKRYGFHRENNILSFIGQLEKVEEQWSFVCQRIGLPEVPELLRSNQTVIRNLGKLRPSYLDAYTDDTRQLVAKTFQFDIEYFEYEFG